MKNMHLKTGIALGLMMVLVFLTGCDPTPPGQQEYDAAIGSVPGDDYYQYGTLYGELYDTSVDTSDEGRPHVESDPNLGDITLPGVVDDPDDPSYAADYPERVEMYTELEYTIFAPRPQNSDETFPVVLFLHGNGGPFPKYYQLWINHIVKKGNIVIYPRYQNLEEDDSEEAKSHYLIGAICAIKLALKDLEDLTMDGVKVNADLEKFALIGHSLGGSFAAYIAAKWGELGLPTDSQGKAKLDVLLLADPTDANIGAGMPLQVDLPVAVPEYSGETGLFSGSDIYAGIPGSTLFLAILAANRTTEVMYDWTKEVFIKSTNVAKRNKNMIVMVSDDHGRPDLLAHHFAINAMDESMLDDGPLLAWFEEKQGGVNALDFYGYWKLFDGLCSAAFAGDADAKKYALWDGEETAPAEQTFMGMWSDDTPVQPLLVFPGKAIDGDSSVPAIPADLPKDAADAAYDESLWVNLFSSGN